MLRDTPNTPANPDEQGAPALRIRLFGHVVIEVDGAPFKLATPRKTLPILAYLLLNRDVPVARDFLAYVMWPDDEEESARNKLRMSLYDLGRVLPRNLGGNPLLVDGDSVRLRPDLDLWLDVTEFDRYLRDSTRLEDAVALYRGDLLATLYDEWVVPERERRRSAYLAALTRLVSRARRERHFATGIARAQEILALDPWREDIVRQLVAIRSESGDRAGALAEYERFAARLRTELNVDPMPETVSLREAIVRGAVVQTDAAFEPADPEKNAGHPPILPFVGRRAEIGLLLETWSRAVRGRGACVFIGGETGIGKSRLAVEFAHAVEDRGGRVLFGSTGSPESTPYESIVDALRSALPLLASLKGADMWLACVAALLPEIRTRIGSLPALPRLDAESERIRLLEALFRCLASLAQGRPLLVVLEDLHWAQSASIGLLDFLVRRISAVPIVIVVTYRDDETPRPHPLHRVRREARQAGIAQSLALQPFSMSNVKEVVAGLPDSAKQPAAALLEASEGNPLFLTQLVADYREGADIGPPASLQAIVARRLERLSPEARTVAEIAACIGDRFSRDAVREVSGWDEGTLGNALDELLDRRIVREAPGRGLFEYTFAHHAVQEAVAHAASPERAVGRQRRVARVLEELYADRAPELSAAIARHYELAGDAANAARWYLAAMRRAIALGALDEARSERDRALALAADARLRADLLLESETIESRRGDRTAWNATLVELDRVAAGLDDLELHRVILLRRIEFALNIGDRVTHERAIRELRMRAPDDDPYWRGTLHVAESRLAFSLGLLGESAAAAEAALACCRESRNEAGAAQALCCLANVEANRGRLTEADALFDEAARAAVHATSPVVELQSFWSAWMIAYQRRDIARGLALCERWLERTIALGDRPGEAKAHGHFGVSLSAAGVRYAEAREHFATAAAIYSENGNLSGTAGELLNQAVLETRLGFFNAACIATEKAVAIFESLGDARGRVVGLGNLGFLRACIGQADGAREAAREAFQLARKLEFRLIEASALENLSFAEAASGNLAKAIEHAEASLELRANSESQVWASKTLADLAVWYAASDDRVAANDAVRRMLVDDEAITGGNDWPEYCYWAAAQVFHLDGNLDEAAYALERAQSIVQTTIDDLDPADRESYLAITWHVDMQQAAENDIWPTPPR